MFKNETVDKLKEMNLSPETEVTLTYSGGCDCFVYNETEVETALEYTDVVSEFAEMVSKQGLNFTDVYGNNVIEDLVEKELIEREFVSACWAPEDEDETVERDYVEDDLNEAICEAINDNFWDQESIEKEVERYDHKRGFITLTATLKTTVGAILEHTPHTTGWKTSVPLHGGTFIIGE